MRTIDHWINGALSPSTSGRSGVVYNPATGQQQAEVGLASIEEVDAAVAAAKAAFPGWRSTSLSRRAEVMFTFRSLVVSHRDEIAELVSIEHGKVPSDAAGELARGIENIEFACGIPAMLKGGYSEGVSGGVDVYSIKQPLGVVAGITPFNFPAMVPMWMFANAIATGNCFILKPSEKDPSVALLLADLLKQAGIKQLIVLIDDLDRCLPDTAIETLEAVRLNSQFPVAYGLIVMTAFAPVVLAWTPSLVAGTAMLAAMSIGAVTSDGDEELRLITAGVAALLVSATLLRLRLTAIKALGDEQARSAALVTTDVLTGTLTRHGLLTVMPTVAGTAERTGEHVCLMYFDVEHLATANEQYGVHYGDDLSLIHI